MPATLDAAAKKTNELTEAGKAYGIKTYPALRRVGQPRCRARRRSRGTSRRPTGARKRPTRSIPPRPPSRSCAPTRAASRRTGARRCRGSLRGFANIFRNYRSRLLSRADLLITILLAIALTAGDLRARALRPLRPGDGPRLPRDPRRSGCTAARSPCSPSRCSSCRSSSGSGRSGSIFYWFIIFFGYAKPRRARR